MKAIHVVAGVIRDTRGRILLARRTEGRDLAGLWEFPGGKVEPGEGPEAALARELHEELGIEARVGAPLICVPQHYPGKTLRLDVRMIDTWHGPARGREGQALAWVPPDKLAGYAMPSADRPVVAALRDPSCYAISPRSPDAAALSTWLDGAIAAGAGRVQLRDFEHLPLPALDAIVRRATDAGVPVLVNADIALAQRLDCGVHLKAGQLLRQAARPLGSGHLVAASCHDAAELAAAERLGCDFAVLGPVAVTASHPAATPLGWEGFAALRAGVSLPLYALGGMSPADVAQARSHGAQGIAAIRAFAGHAQGA